MKIISALGGGGSTFVITALEKQNFGHRFPGMTTFKLHEILRSRYPFLVRPFLYSLQRVGEYRPQFKILRRPDAFWTDYQYHEAAVYDPDHPAYSQHLQGQKAYLLRFITRRSAGIPVVASEIAGSTLPALVNTYVKKMQDVDKNNPFTIVLVAAHWGEYGIFKALNLDTIYLIRDPFNALISHAKPIRHQFDYERRGLADINSRSWIDAYLFGPAHHWVGHARAALSHPGAIVVRYNHFQEDWQQVKGLPDISRDFVYKQNDVRQILNSASIAYIYEQTKEICQELDLELPVTL